MRERERESKIIKEDAFVCVEERRSIVEALICARKAELALRNSK